MVLNKKGDTLSINVIIVAAIALIVLVVIVAIFMGRIGIFEKGVSKEGQTELAILKVNNYGNCHPGTAAEAAFSAEYGIADATPESQESAVNSFKAEIERCAAVMEKAACEAESGCSWS